MSEAPVPLSAQADEAERAFTNLSGHVDRLHDLASRDKRPRAEYQMQADRLAASEAVAKSMRWLANHPGAATLMRQAGGSAA